jgi:hypothetical protein
VAERPRYAVRAAGVRLGAVSGVVLEAVLERVTYVSEETGYTIARVAPVAAATC